MTTAQAKFILRLADPSRSSPLRTRICEALQDAAKEPWISAFEDLLTILNEPTEEQRAGIATCSTDQMDAMRCNLSPDASVDDIRNRIVKLRTMYDWRALRAVVSVCPGTHDDGGAGFRISDLFNVLDMHQHSGHGFPVECNEFLTPQRISGARNALKMLLMAMFYVDWQHHRITKRRMLGQHYDFARALGRRMQRRAMERTRGATCDGRWFYMDRDFYLSDVSFVSMNYDPIALWCQWLANRDLNHSSSVPHIGCPARRVQLFHDYGHFVPSYRVGSTDQIRFPMNESAAQRLNDCHHGASDRILLSKFLLPHGCLWWRECPSCGKLSSYQSNTWDIDSPTLIPPPPLKKFVQEGDASQRPEERDAWEKGEVDVRKCVHCETLTYTHHAPIRMQSNFKGAAPPFLAEIERDLRVLVKDANHVVFMGYSLPRDDVDYRAFFAARSRRYGANRVKCSVIIGKGDGRRWLGPSEWSSAAAGKETLDAACEIFGKENVRYYGGGIPNVFMDGDEVTNAAMDRLLNWDRLT
ncbi:MAG: hypothetical protein OXO48_01685 [Caldilineaceae bacterium]|nr:hypothetical protein [Caldilineaceae bacterium]